MTLLLALVWAGGVRAQDQDPPELTDIVDTTRWVCRFCIYPGGWFGSLDFGPGVVSDSSLAFGDYRGLEDSGLFLSLGGDVHYRDRGDLFFDLYSRNLAIDSRQIDMRGGKQGRYEIRLGYSEIPKFRGIGTQTPFTGQGSGDLTLPSDWVRASATTGMSTLNQSLVGTALKTERKTLDAGLTWKFASKWSYRIDFEHQKKDGTRPFGAGLFLSNTTHLPAPVDFTTDQFDMAVEYAGFRSQLRFGFIGSSFDNGQSTLSWDNPFQSPPGTDVFRADLAPDNKYYQFNVSGAYSPSSKVHLSGRAALGRMKQDDPLLPYTINPNFSELTLPRTSLDGKIDTSTLNLSGKLTARLARRLDFSARIKTEERDNKTAIDLWTPVLTDLIPTPERPNRPYSFKREKYELNMRWRARNGIRVLGGVRQEDIERSLQSVEKTDERTFWGELSFSPWSIAHFRVKLESSERDASPYALLEDGGPRENPLMRKFHLADRKRDRVILELDLSPNERLGISFSYFKAEDEYSASLVGLRDSQEQSISIDVNYAVNALINIYAFANLDDIDSDISSISGGSGIAWNASTADEIDTLGFGLNGKISKSISFGFDWVNSDARGNVLTQTNLGEDPFPSQKSDLQNAQIHLSYRVNTRWGIKLNAEHEKYDSTDWAIDGIGVDGIPAVLTFGAVSPDYSVTVLRILANYKF